MLAIINVTICKYIVITAGNHIHTAQTAFQFGNVEVGFLVASIVSKILLVLNTAHIIPVVIYLTCKIQTGTQTVFMIFFITANH